MRFRTFQIARLFGIPVIVDYSWLPVVALHVWLASAFYLPQQTGGILPVWEYFVFGTLMTVLLFASILAHELAHALMARLEGVEIHDIQLHIFGGWTRLASEPDTPLGELRIAIAGPSASFLVGIFFIICLFIAQATAPDPALHLLLRKMFVYLFLGNFVLAMFNLLPGLPLDGGRALRAWLWYRKGDVLEATRVAKQMGVGIAYMISSFGIFSAFWWGDYLTAVWMVIVGFFLKNVAENDYRHRQRVHAAEEQQKRAESRWRVDGTVGAIMTAPAVSVSPDCRVSEFVERTLAEHRHTSFPVAREGRLHGMLSLARLREVPQEEWERVAIRDVMQPVSDDVFITVRASLAHAAHKLQTSPFGHLAVVDIDGMLVGYLGPGDLKRMTAEVIPGVAGAP
jgi:Zn-dependent protease/CBS domain-containing protein